MLNEQNSGGVAGPHGRGRQLLRPRSVLILAVAVILMVSALLLEGKSKASEPFAIKGGSPYSLNVLLASTVVKSLPSNLHFKEIGAIARIPSRSQFVSALDNQGIVVSYNGNTYSSNDIAWEEATCLQAAIEVATNNAYVQGLDPTIAVSEVESSSYCLDQSIALMVFKQAANDAAISSGHGATLAQAQAYAQQQFVAQQAFDASPNAPQLPAGQTAQSMTLCSACILVYQQDLNLQYETAAITGSTSSGPTQSTKLLDWFSNVMKNTSTLSITNVPSATASNLASFLPWARSGAQ
jgi:hypothetical protein